MTDPLLALAGGGLVGTADFFAGSATKRLPAAVVAATGQAIGVAALLTVMTVTNSWSPPKGHLLWAVGAGVLSSVSLSAFYIALARGPMGLVAPVVSAAVAVPVVAGLAAGDRPGDLAALGLFAVVLGLALARAPAARRKGNPEHQHLGAALMVAPGRPPTAALAAGAALGFGLVYVLLAHAAAGSAYMAVLTFRCTSLTMLGLWFVMHRETTRPTRREVLTLGLIGTADIAAGTAYTAAAAASGALLTIDALLYNTYPIVTLALGRVLHKERLSHRQQVAGGLTLLGALLIVT